MIRFLALLLVFTCDTSGIVLFASADPERNTVAPSGEFAQSGWDLQGEWGEFLGTPVGPRHFVTAVHVGGVVGDSFLFRGRNYRTVAAWNDPGSDLRILEVSEDFPEFAALYDGEDETGKPLIVFGRGAVRGGPVFVEGVLQGWRWGAWDRRMRWGTNMVSALAGDRKGMWPGKITLAATFDEGAGADEAHLAVGDSGGGVFIRQGGSWRLAGVNYTVDGPFYDPERTGNVDMLAALYDMRGIRIPGDETPSGPSPIPSRFYAMRIKARLDWINGILALPTTPRLLGASGVERTFAPAGQGTIDAALRTVRVPINDGTAFFRLESSVALTIRNARIENGTLVFEYSE